MAFIFVTFHNFFVATCNSNLPVLFVTFCFRRRFCAAFFAPSFDLNASIPSLFFFRDLYSFLIESALFPFSCISIFNCLKSQLSRFSFSVSGTHHRRSARLWPNRKKECIHNISNAYKIWLLRMYANLRSKPNFVVQFDWFALFIFGDFTSQYLHFSPFCPPTIGSNHWPDLWWSSHFWFFFFCFQNSF